LPSPLGSPISVVYGTPTVANGAPPVTTVCTPTSGSVFTVGPTSVMCTATDNQQRVDSCTFTVTVTAPPKLVVNRFVAFGDSMTAGEVVSASGFIRTLRIVPSESYPTELQKNLTGFYTAQANSITVANQGRSGEKAVDGYARLRTVLSQGNYEVLTL